MSRGVDLAQVSGSLTGKLRAGKYIQVAADPEATDWERNFAITQTRRSVLLNAPSENLLA